MTRPAPALASNRRIIGLAVAALGALIVEPLYVLVDTAIVGRLGTAELGGLALSATVLSLVVSACTFLIYGTTERVARRIGAGDRTGAASTGAQAIWLAMIVALPLAALIYLGAGPLARSLGGTAAVEGFAITYLRISAFGVPAVIFVLAAQGVQRGVADYRTPMVILLASNAVNAVLEVWFVFGLGWGVPGSAWSTVIAQWAAAFVFIAVIRRHLAPAAQRRPSWTVMQPLVSAGRHLLVRSAAMLVVIVGATSIAARTDEVTLAAHQIAASVLMLSALLLDALAIPAQTLVAEQLGAGSVATAAATARRVVRLTLWCALAVAMVIAAASPLLPRLFTADDAVTARATVALLILAALLLPGAVAYALDGVLIGLGDYRFLGRAAAAVSAVLLPFGAVVLGAEWGIAGIWAGLALWLILRAAINTTRSHRLLGPPAA